MASQQQLSNKDEGLFRQVVRLYESKQYKKGLKQADQILKKNPNNAQTQAMKALIIGAQGNTQEAFALAKIALANNMKSHVCWHVYGLLYRQEKNFEESVKAYKFALRLDPDSVTIQRDLAFLQIHVRDYAGYLQSRKAMLQQKPGFRQNWTALAIAHHLAGEYEDAERVLTTYEETLQKKIPRADMEHWEAVLYKNTIIAESGETEKALEHLEAIGKKIPDVLGVMELKADYLLRLGRNEEAAEAYSALLNRNPDNSGYYNGYVTAKGLQQVAPEEAKKTYDEIASRHPRSDLPKRRPLDFLSGDAFRSAADTYLLRMLRKGVPSTFANIKQLYGDTSKKQIIQDLVEGYAAGGAAAKTNGTTDNNEKEEENFKWSVPYFLAQHYNYRLSRDLAKSLQYSDKGLELDPKSVDFHAVRARTLKYQGKISEAADLMDKARGCDEKDRAINTKAAKYHIRNDDNEKAIATAGKFTQNKTSGGPLADLIDMQAVWYLTEDGQSYLRQRQLGLALKRFHQVSNIFDVWQEDQFDFHGFSLRKGMIRAYVNMVRWEDHLRDHPFYAKMAISAIEAYLLLADNPDLVHGPIMNGVNGADGSAESAAERKKALKKAKREQEKLEKAEAGRKAAQKAAKPTPKADVDEVKKEDTDPLGKSLVETKQPIEDAVKFLGPLLEHNPDNITAQTLGFDVYMRRHKYLLATKCLLAIHAIDPQSGELHICAYRLREALTTSPPELSEKIKEIVVSETKNILQADTKPEDWNSTYHQQHPGSMKHLLAYAQVERLINPASQEKCEKELVTAAASEEIELDEAIAGLRLLQTWNSKSDVQDAYRTSARKPWPEANVFQSLATTA